MNVFDRRSGLEILHVNQWIFAQQNIRGQDPVWIKEVFYAPHQIRELIAPFAPALGKAQYQITLVDRKLCSGTIECLVPAKEAPVQCLPKSFGRGDRGFTAASGQLMGH